MKKPPLTLLGGSSLMQFHPKWRNLKEDFETKFYEFHDWGEIILRLSLNNILVVIVNLDDFTDHRATEATPNTAKLNDFVLLLDKRLKTTKQVTIIAATSGIKGTLIRYSRKKNPKESAFRTLVEDLTRLSVDHSNLLMIDLDREFGQKGCELTFDARNWYHSRCHFSSTGISIVSKSIEVLLKRVFNPAAKVLVLDCDNTLWGGVIGEDGLQGLKLGGDGNGRAFRDFQSQLKNLMTEGLLLAVASKNNQEEVLQVFEKHPNMILKRDDIASWRVNWAEKAVNIQEIASELDLGLNSFLFWDDNPLERQKVRNLLPEVTTVEPPLDIAEWPVLLGKLDEIAKIEFTPEDKRKGEQYRARANFIREKSSTSDVKGYLKSIKLNPKALPIDQFNISRAVQLCQKTNQFNLRLIRHDTTDINELVRNEPRYCFLVQLADIYGDHGIVGLVCMRPISSRNMFLDTFLMSCRVIGRHLEAWMLNEAIERCKENGYSRLVGEFRNSKTNQMMESFLLEHGFKDSGENISQIESTSISNQKQYYIDIHSANIPNLEAYEAINT